MAQHFSQSKAFRDKSLWEIAGLSEEEARKIFAELRWGSNEVMPCPICGVVEKHYARRTRNQWRCKECDAVFSVTTGTPFADRKLPFKKILGIIYEFISAPSGCAANRLHSRLDMSLRTAYLNLAKLREVLWETQERSKLTGLVQIDGGHFCGKPRRPNKRSKATSTIVNSKLRNRKAGMVPDKSVTHAEPWNIEKFKNRRIVLVLRELNFPLNSKLGAKRTITVVLPNEYGSSVLPAIQKYVDPSAEIWTDCGTGYSKLSAYYDHSAVNHSLEYMRSDGVNNNQAESFFGRMRRSEYGVYHGMRHPYVAFYAAEYAWKEDARKCSLNEKFEILMQKIFKCGHSKAWRRYTQGHRLGFEYIG